MHDVSPSVFQGSGGFPWPAALQTDVLLLMLLSPAAAAIFKCMLTPQAACMTGRQ